MTDRAPLVLAHGPAEIRRLAISTGAAGYDLIQAAHEGYDASSRGSPRNRIPPPPAKLGIHLVAAGHHATERFGVQALAAHLAERPARVALLRVDNPV